MNGWAEDFIARIETEAIEKGEHAEFSEVIREFKLDDGPADPYEALEYAHQVSKAVRAAEGYARKIGLLISERRPQAIPFDKAFQGIPEGEA
jgi:hypothetical protein